MSEWLPASKGWFSTLSVKKGATYFLPKHLSYTLWSAFEQSSTLCKYSLISMLNFGLIEKNMELSHIYLAVCILSMRSMRDLYIKNVCILTIL
jgi:hypothetical protein